MLPNLLVIGAQKSGTTWLHNVLNMHPKIRMSSPKELSFFNQPGNRDNAEALYEYERNFQGMDGASYVGESTPHYFWVKEDECAYSPPDGGHDTAAFVKSTLGGEVNLLLVLRNPVERALSAFGHHFAMGRIASERILETDPRLGIVDMGFYSRHVTHWSQTFGDQLKVFLYDDMVGGPDEFYQDVIRSLNLPPVPMPDRWRQSKPNNRTSLLRRKRGVDAVIPEVSEDEKMALRDLYADEITFVEDTLGRRLGAWRDTANAR